MVLIGPLSSRSIKLGYSARSSVLPDADCDFLLQITQGTLIISQGISWLHHLIPRPLEETPHRSRARASDAEMHSRALNVEGVFIISSVRSDSLLSVLCCRLKLKYVLLLHSLAY
jgi:hypothetical protein